MFSNLGAKPIVPTLEMRKWRLIVRLAYCPHCCHSLKNANPIRFLVLTSTNPSPSYSLPPVYNLPKDLSYQQDIHARAIRPLVTRFQATHLQPFPELQPYLSSPLTRTAYKPPALSSMLFLASYSTWISFPMFFTWKVPPCRLSSSTTSCLNPFLMNTP